MRINRLGGDDKFAQILREVRQVQQAAMLGNSSVTNGRTRFAGNESLIVEGSQKVSGWLIVTGTLKVVGTFLLEGVTTITGALTSSGTALFTGAFTSRGITRFEGDTTQVGAFHVTGPTDVTGNLTARGTTRLEGDTSTIGASHIVGNQDITGTLAIKGTTTLEKNLILSGADGKIIAGVVSLDSGGTLRSTNALLIVAVGLTTVQNDFRVFGATNVASLSASGVTSLANLASNTTSSAANVFANATTGQLQRVTSASRFKFDQQLAVLPDALLDVPVKDWLDSGQVATAFALESAPRPWTEAQSKEWAGLFIRRVPGVVAEEVEAAGGELFTTYDGNGRVEGVAYDRLALARTQILADRLAEAFEEIRLLREQMAA